MREVVGGEDSWAVFWRRGQKHDQGLAPLPGVWGAQRRFELLECGGDRCGGRQCPGSDRSDAGVVGDVGRPRASGDLFAGDQQLAVLVVQRGQLGEVVLTHGAQCLVQLAGGGTGDGRSG